MRRKLWILLAAVLLFFCGASPAAAAQEVYAGIDVSTWQGEIDFSQVKSSGIELVYIRAGYDLTEDNRFAANAVGAERAGLRVGFYYFVTAQSADEAIGQAEFFAGLIKKYNYACRPAVDFEQFGDLSDAEINEVALTFCQILEQKTGITPLFYTDANDAATLWDSALQGYPLWVADYGVASPGSLGPWQEWAGWQYADQGEIAGISDQVDLDHFKSAVFISASDPLPFTDVPQTAWYYDSVLPLYKDGIIAGITSTEFAPLSPATRIQAVVMLYRLHGEPAVTTATPFVDVPRGVWYYDSVSWAVGAGIAKGQSATRFAPEAGAQRQELVTFLYRYARYNGYDVSKQASLLAYGDENTVASWALPAMQWAVAEGIVQGRSSTRLAPGAVATRAELAAIMARMANQYP